MHRIAVIGTGYVGLVTGTCLADFGLTVTCVDTDKEKIKNLKQGILPIYEPGLENLVERNSYYRRLSFTTDCAEAVKNSDVVFIAVGTPPKEDGSADLRHVEAAARDIARHLEGHTLIVTKSTVPVGTNRRIKDIVAGILAERGIDSTFDVVSNPEFLREGNAVYDFTHPDRVVLGTESEKAAEIMKEVYRVLYLNETPFIVTGLETAEMIKYASNAFLALKITYINEIANLCEAVGADVHHVAKAMGRDGRISPKFLHPGPGYGGSCFPKDTKALADMARRFGSPVTLVEGTIEANEAQKRRMAEKVLRAMGGDLSGRTVAVLGLTFKPRTDDMREAAALTILPLLAEAGARLKAFDPEGMKEAAWRLADFEHAMDYCRDEYEAAQGADALLILTEWHQFRNMDLKRLKNAMKGKWFFDFRNIYERPFVEQHGFRYDAVGR